MQKKESNFTDETANNSFENPTKIPLYRTWESGARFLNQSHIEEKQNQSKRELLCFGANLNLPTYWKIELKTWTKLLSYLIEASLGCGNCGTPVRGNGVIPPSSDSKSPPVYEPWFNDYD